MTPAKFLAAARSLRLARRHVALLYVSDVAMAGLEALSLVALAPLIQFLQHNGDTTELVARSELWRRLVDAYGLFGTSPGLGTLLLTSFLFIVLRQVMGYVSAILVGRGRSRFVQQLRDRMFGRFIRLDIGVQERMSSGGFVNAVAVEVDGAAVALFQSVRLVGMITLLVIYGTLLLFLSWQMTLLTVAIGAVAALSLRGVFRSSFDSGQRLAAANEGLARFLSERLRLLRLIRMSGMEAAELAAFTAITAAQRRHLLDIERDSARVSVSLEPAFAALAFGFLYVGYTRFSLGLAAIGLFMVVMLRLVPLAKEVMRCKQTIIAFEPQLESLLARFGDLERAGEPPGGDREFTRIADGIELRKVVFTYATGQVRGHESEPETAALRGIDLSFKAGEMTALVGPSGSGKSTLIDLLPRLRTPSAGSILYDDVPIESFSLASLRRGLSFAPQSPQIFDVTVAEHIRYGNPSATDSEVRDAAVSAGALAFIDRLPDGFDTRLREGGAVLSGGQRQRLDLARALVRRSPVLILDEPTAALDAASEAEFKTVIQRLKAAGDTTIILIGHRLSLVAIADRIAVLDAGRVVETGTHAELLASGQWYARAWTTQTNEPQQVRARRPA